MRAASREVDGTRKPDPRYVVHGCDALTCILSCCYGTARYPQTAVGCADLFGSSATSRLSAGIGFALGRIPLCGTCFLDAGELLAG